MSFYKIVVTEKALSDLQKLDKGVVSRILRKLKYFENSKEPLRFAVKLKDSSLGDYRFRVGEYRILFDLNEADKITVLAILAIKHRKDIYKNL